MTVPKDLVVLSNGALQGKQPRDDGTVVWHWVQAKSHVPYLMSVVVGDFEKLSRGDEVMYVETMGDVGPTATKVRVKEPG